MITASTVIMFTVLFLLWYWILRKLSGTIRIVSTVLSFILVATLRALILFGVLPGVATVPMRDGLDELRAIVYAVLTVVLLLVGTLIVERSRQDKQRIQEVLTYRLTVDELAKNIDRAAHQDQQEATESIEAALTAELSTITADSPGEAIDVAQTLVADVVRPLSHQLAGKVPPVPMPQVNPDDFAVSWRSLWRKVPVEQYIRPLWASAVTILYVMLSQLVLFDIGLKWHYLLAVPVLWAGLWAANFVIRSIASRIRGLVRYIVCTLIILLAVLPAVALVTFISGPQDNGWRLAGVLTLEAVLLTWITAIATGLAASLRGQREQAEELMRSLTWSKARGRATLWRTNAQLARALHGPVQSELHAALFAMRSTDDESTVSTTELVDQLNKRLPQLLANQEDQLSFEKECVQAAALWQGIANVEVDVDPTASSQLTADSIANDLAVSIVHDAIPNAIRHGKATTVTVSLTQPTEDTLLIQVDDNGSQGLGPGGQGLGSQQLEECAIEWSRIDHGSGCSLMAVIPTVGVT